MIRSLCVALCILLAAAACGDGDAGGTTTSTRSPTTVATTTTPTTSTPPPEGVTTSEAATTTTGPRSTTSEQPAVPGRLAELGAAVPSEYELASFMEVQDLIVDGAGGPGDAGFLPARADLANLIGGYHLMFRLPEGRTDSGWLSLVLFDTADDAAAVAAQSRVANDPETAGLIRAEFDVVDMLADGEGVVVDPEADPPFTSIIGSRGPVVVYFVVFHEPDEDRTDAATSVVFEVVEWLEGIGL